MDTIEFNGLRFRVEIEQDTDYGPPWEEYDGHGPVSEWTRRDKRPGERELCEDRGVRRFYDWQEAIKIATRDGWGLSDEVRAELAARLGREPTKREVIAEAVQRDFEYLRRWCNDQWYYVGVVVTLLDIEGEPTHETESLWGIESDARDYLEQVARELAEQIAERVGDAATLTHTTRARTETVTIRETHA